MDDITDQVVNQNLDNNQAIGGRRKNDMISDGKRELVVDMMNRGLPAGQVSDTLKVKYKTVQSIYRRYIESGQTHKKARGRKPNKLTDE